MQNMVENSVEEMKQPFEVVQQKLVSWWESALALLPNFVAAIVVVVFFSFLGWMVKRLVRKTLSQFVENRSIRHVLAAVAQIIVIGVGIFIALGLLQLDKTVTSLLAGAGVIGLALAFAFQDLASNLIAGFYMSFRTPFVPGDLIETDDTFGTVEKTDLRSTSVRTPEGQIVLIPNREIFENKLKNFSRSGRHRVDLQVGVSYADNLELVRNLTLKTLEGLELIDQDNDIEFFYQEFGSSSIDFVVRFWIPFSKQGDYHLARSEAIILIKKTFDENGITIPFPIRTLDFGIKGGETLRDALPSSASSFSENESSYHHIDDRTAMISPSM